MSLQSNNFPPIWRVYILNNPSFKIVEIFIYKYCWIWHKFCRRAVGKRYYRFSDFFPNLAWDKMNPLLQLQILEDSIKQFHILYYQDSNYIYLLVYNNFFLSLQSFHHLQIEKMKKEYHMKLVQLKNKFFCKIKWFKSIYKFFIDYITFIIIKVFKILSSYNFRLIIWI